MQVPQEHQGGLIPMEDVVWEGFLEEWACKPGPKGCLGVSQVKKEEQLWVQ
jgi:hypothetical protein